MGHAKLITRPTPLAFKVHNKLNKMLGLLPVRKSEQRRRDLEIHNIKPFRRIEYTNSEPKFLSQNHGQDGRVVTRRQVILNRHFTEILSDVLANDIDVQLSDIGIRITSIETKPWGAGVDIFYASKDPFKYPLHASLQKTLVTDLRAAVAERKLIGYVPPINFVYDNTVLADQILDKAFGDAPKSAERAPSELITLKQNEATELTQPSYTGKPDFFAKMFDAPADMTNNVYGLDYRRIYNIIAEKMPRGRGQSERMIPHQSVAAQGPFIHIPKQKKQSDSSEDPEVRIREMRRFIVRQRKKIDFQAKLRRKEELLHRDSVKWDLPGDEAPDEEDLSEV